MDNNKIVEEIDTLCLEATNPVIVCDGRGDETVLEEPNTVNLNNLNTLNHTERDLHVIHSKRLELDNIQRDLDDLMHRLNSFIADSQDDPTTDEVSLDNEPVEEEQISNLTEKQDGPPEKELRLNSYASGESLVNKIYISDGSNPPEINWDAVGPILQKHVTDLQRLHNLNQMTNAVVKRIRNVTQINEAILKETSKKEDDA